MFDTASVQVTILVISIYIHVDLQAEFSRVLRVGEGGRQLWKIFMFLIKINAQLHAPFEVFAFPLICATIIAIFMIIISGIIILL